jgi:regulatory protein
VIFSFKSSLNEVNLLKKFLFIIFVNMKTSRPITPANALQRVANLCSRSEQAEADIRTKLVGWGVLPADVEAIIERLKRENYLSDERYVRAFVRDKFRFNDWGRIKIAFMLKQKGFGKDIIDSMLATIDEDEYKAKLTKLLLAKHRDVAGREPQLARAALLRYAASKGFEPDVFFPLVSQVLNSGDDED